MKAKMLGNYKAKDIELCRTTSRNAGQQTVEALVESRIPFTKISKRIPFFQREKYHGATEVHVISINMEQYGQARRVIDHMETLYRKKLVVSNY